MSVHIARVRRNGHSLGIVLVHEIQRALGLKANDMVMLRVDDGVLTLAKLSPEDLAKHLYQRTSIRSA